MSTSIVSEHSVQLPPRPWLIGGQGLPCLILVQGMKLIPVFRTAVACRDFMARAGNQLPDQFYPLFPDEREFVQLLGVALRDGAQGYVLVDQGTWYVLRFAVADTAQPVAAATA